MDVLYLKINDVLEYNPPYVQSNFMCNQGPTNGVIGSPLSMFISFFRLGEHEGRAQVPSVAHNNKQYSSPASSQRHACPEIQVVRDPAVEEAPHREDSRGAEEDDGRGAILFPAKAKDGGKTFDSAHRRGHGGGGKAIDVGRRGRKTRDRGNGS